MVEAVGNLSVISPNGSLWIIPSGRFKGELLVFNVAFKVIKN
ncbi:hypothetical protein COO91_08929 [Nostoc flagelliforme CCNUN1]|uniref:Uncharacterized protein n=1 Tax=Nostoc flagelliforme CCNUN1 TaxID=2038116 RepID=A0A2K8T5C5_9NOSO|nr:hypothetical protein COO91_08929 [Nostoc flagelliforme CCNUN1]